MDDLEKAKESYYALSKSTRKYAEGMPHVITNYVDELEKRIKLYEDNK